MKDLARSSGHPCGGETCAACMNIASSHASRSLFSPVKRLERHPLEDGGEKIVYDFPGCLRRRCAYHHDLIGFPSCVWLKSF